MKLRLLSTLALPLSPCRGRGRRVGRRPGQAVPVPRRAAQRQRDAASPCRSRAATGPRCAPCSARARTRRSRSAPKSEVLIWRHGIPTVGTTADLKQGDWITVNVRAHAGSSLAEVESHPVGIVADRVAKPNPPSKPLWLYVGTVAGPQSGGHIALHVKAGNRRALRSMIGQAQDQTFTYSDDTIFLLWQGKVPTVIDASQLKAGDRITVRIRAPKGSTLAQVEATAANHVGDHEPGNPATQN